MRAVALLMALCVLLSGCGGQKPPPELAGLWSAGPAACEAGIGLKFERDAVAAIYAGARETLFESPRYEALRSGDHFGVRIT